MKRAFAVLFLLCLVAAALPAQLKTQSQEESSASRSLIHPSTGLTSFLGLLNADNFMMRHSVSMSYMTYGGRGISVADYTNSMFYKISDPLNLRFDVTLQGSPFGQTGGLSQSDLSGVFLSRAELNYRPSRDFMLSLHYQRVPFGQFGWYDSPFSDQRWGDENSPR
jgi:hypothetical protein